MQCDSGAAVYEFFAGGGLARLGLGGPWRVTMANDIDATKATAYRAAFGAEDFRQGDVWQLKTADLPGRATLAWASFPCQDLSVAGARAGLAAPRSGAFFGFWRLMEGLAHEGRAPPLIVLENVLGLFTSHGGADLAAIASLAQTQGYTIGALGLDAAHFVPQSRPRAFVVLTRRSVPLSLKLSAPDPLWHPRALVDAVAAMPDAVRAAWVWWRLPPPPRRNTDLAMLIDWSAPCHPEQHTQALLAMMAPRQRQAVADRQAKGGAHVGAAFRRMRTENGRSVQRVEVRFDGMAGCLRTPKGGSSRQSLILIEAGHVRSRLLGPREAARLMGWPDEWPIPDSTSAALSVFGDGVAAPAVRWLSDVLLEPLAGIHVATEVA